jgi:hypothetical protein
MTETKDRLAEIEHGNETKESLIEILDGENMPNELDSVLWLIDKVKRLRNLVAENTEVTFLEPEQQELMREVGWNG